MTYYFTPSLAGEIGLRYTYEHKDDHLYVFYLNRDIVGVDRQVAQSWAAATPKLPCNTSSRLRTSPISRSPKAPVPVVQNLWCVHAPSTTSDRADTRYW